MAATAVTSAAMATTTAPTAMSAAVATFPVPLTMVPAAVVVVPMMVTATTAPDIDTSVAVRWCIAGAVSVSGIGVTVAGRICDAARQSGC